MKTITATLTSLALLNLASPAASAGDKEWATAGKILTGVVAGAVLVKAFEPAPAYAATTVYSTPVVHAPPPPPVVTVQPAPMVVHHQPVLVQSAPVVVQPTPVFVHHPPVVYHAAPVVLPPPPVYVHAAPVLVQPAPVYVAPRPVVSFSFSFGRAYRVSPVRRVCH